MLKKSLFALALIGLFSVSACTEEERIPATSISFDEPSYMMTVGQTLTLNVKVEPANTTDKVE